MKTMILIVLGGIATIFVAISAEIALGPVSLHHLQSARMIHAGAADDPPDVVFDYKETPTRVLRVHAFRGVRGPQGDRGGATVVLFHGGGFRAGWPDEYFPLASRLSEAGHAVFVPEYRLHGPDGVAFPDELTDCRDAIAAVVRRAGEFGGDLVRLVVGGSSAGAHLAAASVLIPASDRGPAPSVVGLVLSAAYLDSADAFARLVSHPPKLGPISGLLGGEPWDVFEGRSAAHSRLAFVRRGMPPAFVFVGGHDPLLTPARSFCEAVRCVQDDCDLRIFDGAAHGFAVEGRPGHARVVEAVWTAIAGWPAPKE